MYQGDRGGGGGYLLYWLCRADLQPTIPHLNITQTGPQKKERNYEHPQIRLTRPLTLSGFYQYSVGYYVLQLHQKEGIRGNPGFARVYTGSV